MERVYRQEGGGRTEGCLDIGCCFYFSGCSPCFPEAGPGGSDRIHREWNGFGKRGGLPRWLLTGSSLTATSYRLLQRESIRDSGGTVTAIAWTYAFEGRFSLRMRELIKLTWNLPPDIAYTYILKFADRDVGH